MSDTSTFYPADRTDNPRELRSAVDTIKYYHDEANPKTTIRVLVDVGIVNRRIRADELNKLLGNSDE